MPGQVEDRGVRTAIKLLREGKQRLPVLSIFGAPHRYIQIFLRDDTCDSEGKADEPGFKLGINFQD
jgi:hypothetical protein